MTVVASLNDESLSSTTSTAWVEKLSVSGFVPQGNYKIYVSAEYSSSSITVGASIQITLDGVEVNMESYTPEEVTAPNNYCNFGMAFLSEGEHTVAIRYKANGSATAYIRRARILVEKH